MKQFSTLLGSILAVSVVAGCASASKKAATIHRVRHWDIVQPTGTNGFNKPVAFLVSDEIWSDRYKGGGSALLADPKASQIASAHTNQSALGGSSSFGVGEVESTVSTNALKILSDGVSSVASNVVQAAISAARKP